MISRGVIALPLKGIHNQSILSVSYQDIIHPILMNTWMLVAKRRSSVSTDDSRASVTSIYKMEEDKMEEDIFHIMYLISRIELL